MIGFIERFRFLLSISPAHRIARRYFVTNGFDGALTLFGLIMGFYGSNEVDIDIVISACLGATVALGVSGVTSAYLSESAEKRQELHELESALVADLTDTDHGKASRLTPLLIATVNGFAPVLMAMVIITPLWLERWGIYLPLAPWESAIVSAFGCLFLLGVFIGKISGTFWLWAGLRTALIALITSFIILLLTG